MRVAPATGGHAWRAHGSGAILRCVPAPERRAMGTLGHAFATGGPAAVCPLTPGARTRARGLRNVPEPFRNLVPAPQGTHCVVRRTAACSERDFTRSSVTARHRHGGHGTSKRHNANFLTSLWSFGSCRARGRDQNVVAFSMLFNAFQCFSMLFIAFSMLFNAFQCFFMTPGGPRAVHD